MSTNEPDPCQSLVDLVNAAQTALAAAQAALILCRACNANPATSSAVTTVQSDPNTSES